MLLILEPSIEINLPLINLPLACHCRNGPAGRDEFKPASGRIFQSQICGYNPPLDLRFDQ